MLATWRVIPEGKTADGRDTHDEDGNPRIAPYRGRHIVNGFGSPICEFVHDAYHARLLAAAPKLLAALQLIEVDEDGDGFICREAMDVVREAMAYATGESRHEQA